MNERTIFPPSVLRFFPPPARTLPLSTATMATKNLSVAEAIPPTTLNAAPGPSTGAMALAIQTVTGQRLAVDDAMPSDTLARLRARITLTHGIAANTQRLMVGQVALEEGPRTLAQRGIGPESALFLSLQAADHLLTQRQRAVVAAETAAAEADAAAAELVGALPQPRSRMLLYREDGSVKHWRWFRLSRGAEGARSVSWGKNEDGSDHRLWASCGSGPPKSCEVTGVGADEGPVGVEHGFRILRVGGHRVLVAAEDATTREKWVAALDESQREEAVAALEQAMEALRQALAEMFELEGEAREAQMFVTIERLMADRQMGAEEFGAAVMTLNRALAVDGGANSDSEVRVALERAKRGIAAVETAEFRPLEPGRWSTYHMDLTLSEERALATRTADTVIWASVVCGEAPMAEGRHYAEFAVVKKTDSIFVGVVPAADAGKVARLTDGWWKEPAVHMWASFGDHCLGGRSGRWEGRAGYAQGDVVGLLLDLDRGTLTAYKNGNRLGDMLPVSRVKKLGAGPMYWAVDLSGAGDGVRIARGGNPVD